MYKKMFHLLIGWLFNLIGYVKKKEGIREAGDFQDLYDSSVTWYNNEELNEIEKKLTLKN